MKSLLFIRNMRCVFDTNSIQRSACLSHMNIIRSKKKVAVPYPELDDHYKFQASQPEKGKIYDKKPFKFFCEKDKDYYWCTCGVSYSQPFCDEMCKDERFKINLKCLRFRVKESQDYWFCNCKQTDSRPFCDGTHRRQDIQDAIKTY